MSHTPGPWEVETAHGYPWHVRDSDTCNTICRIGAHASAIEEEEVNEANARLIAAAPDLLAALTPFANAALRRGLVDPMTDRPLADNATAGLQILVKDWRRVIELVDRMREKQGVQG